MEFEKIRNSCNNQFRRILWYSFLDLLFYTTSRIIPNHSSALNGIGYNHETKNYHFANPKTDTNPFEYKLFFVFTGNISEILEKKRNRMELGLKGLILMNSRSDLNRFNSPCTSRLHMYRDYPSPKTGASNLVSSISKKLFFG